MAVSSQAESAVGPSENKRHVSVYAAVVIGMLTVLGIAVSPAPLVVLGSGAVALLTVLCLWWSDEPPILIVPVFLQFAEICLKPITTAVTSTPLQDLSEFGSDLEPAALFGVAGLAALVL